MASGRLGIADLTAGSNTVLYTCPSNTFSVVTISLCNRTSNSSSIRIAISNTTSPTNDPNVAEFIEYESILLPNGVLERTGVVLHNDLKVIVRSSTAGVSAVCYGIETATS